MPLLMIRNFTTSAHRIVSDAAITIIDLVSRGSFDESLKLFKQLHSSGTYSNPLSLPSVLKAAASVQSLSFSLHLHCNLIKTSHDSDLVTANSLLSMYAKHSCVDSSYLVFNTMPQRDSVTWNSMITCYIRNGFFHEALETLKEMCNLGFYPKSELVANVVSVCGKSGGLITGREIHARVICSGRAGQCVFISTAFVDMYSRCYDLKSAMAVFEEIEWRNEVCWTAMIAGCVMNGDYSLSMVGFRSMLLEGVQPNRVTLMTVMPCCAELGALKQGREIHGYAIRREFDSESHFCGALLDMYSKCRASLHLASRVLERAKERDVVMWSSLIRSYSCNGESIEALKLFSRMRMEGVDPNTATILAVISAGIGLSSIIHGQGIHGYTLKSGLNSELFVGNALIDMYSKIGFLDASRLVFAEMPTKDAISWSTLISAVGSHGHGTHAVRLFSEMQQAGNKPDGIAFLAVLSACNHAGLVDQGRELFNQMTRHYRVVPTVEHYACFIDLLGRFGMIREACEALMHLPLKPSPSIWSSLVSACKVHGRYEEAEMLAQSLVNSEPDNPANYTLLSVLYRERGNWSGVEEVRRVMRERGLKRNCGWSRIEIENVQNKNIF
ncbi:pentatricopeptide repeat-containing protein At4g31070, mitochondrial [Aristolochia californica]|uniref:pentatricopeptide repeat-containing protein At4g31070, mitochondrial n=1 Tax=Aristolochia californica TaxID=171875 RepID=UPI0035D6E02A